MNFFLKNFLLEDQTSQAYVLAAGQFAWFLACIETWFVVYVYIRDPEMAQP